MGLVDIKGLVVTVLLTKLLVPAHEADLCSPREHGSRNAKGG